MSEISARTPFSHAADSIWALRMRIGLDVSPHSQAARSVEPPAVASGVPAPPGVAPAAAMGDTLRTDYAAFFTAVSSGDMGAAGAALTTLETDRGRVEPAAGYGRPRAGRLKNDFQALVDAVHSGDAGAASSALQTLLHDVEAKPHHHHHHHGHGGEALPVGRNGAPASDASDVPAPPVPIGAASPSDPAAAN